MADWDQNSVKHVVKCSPSLQLNNLSSNGSTVAFSHQDVVCLVNLSNSDDSGQVMKIQGGSKLRITQTAFCAVGGQVYLVVTANEGFQVWNGEGSTLLYCFAFAKDEEKDNDEPTYSRGISAVNTVSSIVAGTYRGAIYVLSVSKNSIEKSAKLEEHKHAITTIASANDFVASADIRGDVIIWRADKILSLDHVFEGADVPATGIAIISNAVTVGYASGHIRIFNIAKRYVMAEVVAHAEAIFGLSALQSMVATIGRDGFLNVWSIPNFDKDDSDPTVQLIFSKNLPDNLLTGVAFLVNGDIVTTTYDVDAMNVYNLVS